MGRRGFRGPAGALIAMVASLLVFSTAATASPYIHAHRGGPLVSEGGSQGPALPEETLGTLARRAADGYVLEIDVKLTAEQVPVVIHDASLDRTTDCEGNVASFTAAQLRDQCEVDVAGTGG
ncbi:MAG: glycerophosphodiester phosphodiesterase, partial [Solirubrobacterales bacterium]